MRIIPYEVANKLSDVSFKIKLEKKRLTFFISKNFNLINHRKKGSFN